MSRYLMRYGMQVLPVLLIITVVVFVLVYLAGDPVTLMLSEDATPEQIAGLREALGLNQPLYVQYGIFLSDVVQGQFGRSFTYGRDALGVVLERLPNTLLLGGASVLFAIAISIPLGIVSAMRKNSLTDFAITGASVLSKAMPNFWQAIMAILVFAVVFPIFPVSGSGSWLYLVLPAITLGGGAAAEMTRLVRARMIEVLGQDYIRTARSKGLSNAKVIFRHAFRNCLIPVVTVMSTQISGIVGGALLTETVFAWPGIGQLLVHAVSKRDMSIVQAVVFISAVGIILINLLADVTYRLIDPRITYATAVKA